MPAVCFLYAFRPCSVCPLYAFCMFSGRRLYARSMVSGCFPAAGYKLAVSYPVVWRFLAGLVPAVTWPRGVRYDLLLKLKYRNPASHQLESIRARS
jgi:hypothetical protein